MRNIADMPITKKDAMLLLERLQWHFKQSGQKGRPLFEEPRQLFDIIGKLMRKVSVLWVRKAVTHKKHLQPYRRIRRRSERNSYKQNVQVFSNPKKTRGKVAPGSLPSSASHPVELIRAASPKLFGQGFLRKRVPVFPYTPTYTFLAMHRVNVYQNGGRFDVIDAYCNIPILAGLTRQSLKSVVAW